MANAIISANALQLNVVDGLPVVSSLALADNFDKPHNRVLDSIREIYGDLSEDVRSSNFRLSQYDGQTPNGGKRKYPMYLLTRDGFTLVAMGFTGKKALAWKVKYIQAFNEMEMELAKMTSPKRESKALGRSIKSLPAANEKSIHLFDRLHLSPYEKLHMGSKIKQMLDEAGEVGPRTLECIILKARYASAIADVCRLGMFLSADLARLSGDIHGALVKRVNTNRTFSDPLMDTLGDSRHRIDQLGEEFRSVALRALNANICIAKMLDI